MWTSAMLMRMLRAPAIQAGTLHRRRYHALWRAGAGPGRHGSMESQAEVRFASSGISGIQPGRLEQHLAVLSILGGGSGSDASIPSFFFLSLKLGAGSVTY